MSFFRRKKKDEPVPVKKVAGSGTTSPKPAVKPPAPSPAQPPAPVDDPDAAPPTDSVSPAPSTAPTPEEAAAPEGPAGPAHALPTRPPTAPPPLPDPAPKLEGPAPIVPAPKAYCFVCGTALDGGRCPTCQITWVE